MENQRPDWFLERSVATNLDYQRVRAIEDPSKSTKQAISLLKSKNFDTLVQQGKVTFAMIRPGLDRIGKVDGDDVSIAEQIKSAVGPNLEVVFDASVRLSIEAAGEFYGFLRDGFSKASPRNNDYKSKWDEFMHTLTQGPTTLLFLYDNDGEAVSKWRERIGETDPEKAAPGTIRREFARDLQNNVVHGSDSIESVAKERDWVVEQLNQLTI